MDLVNQLREFSIQAQDKVVLMVSGGVDSMVLLDILINEANKKKFELDVFHCNFHLRKEESDQDENFIKDYCQKNKVRFISYQAPIKNTFSIQKKARDLRYQALINLHEKYLWKYAFTAHHYDDQLETIWMRIERGSGIKGLRGILKKRELKKDFFLLRPLLEISKSEILDYAKRNKILYRVDSSNLKTKYLRNNVRINQLPSFKYLDEYKKNCSTQVKLIENYYTKINQKINSFLNSYPQTEIKTRVIPKKAYLSLTQTERFFLLETLFLENNYPKQFSENDFIVCEDLIKNKASFIRNFAHLSLYGGYQHIHLHPQYINPSLDWEKEFNPHQEESISIPTINKKLILRKMTNANSNDFEQRLSTKKFWTLNDFNQPLLIDIKKDTQLRICFFKPGDQFNPLGMKGKMKLKKYFNEHKIPCYLRGLIPLICSKSEIIAILGVEISNCRKVTSHSEEVIEISLK